MPLIRNGADCDGTLQIFPQFYGHALSVGVVPVRSSRGVVWFGKSIFCKAYTRGIWFAGVGTVLTVLALLLVVGYNHTAYYPSTADLQSSLTIANSCSSQFTLKTMAYVSILVPFVLAYIIYAWRAIDRKPLTMEEIKEDEHSY